MNWYGLFPLGSFVLNLFLWTYVFASARPTPAKQVYLFFVALAAIWGLSDFFAWNAASADTALLWARAASFTWVSVTIVYLHFAHLLVGRRFPRVFHALTGLVVLFIIAACATPWILESVEKRPWGYVPITGWLYPACIVVTVLIPGVMSLVVVAQRAFKADGIERTQLWVFLIGIFLSWTSASVVNILLVIVLGIESIPSLGSTLISFQAIFVFFASTRYRFLSAGVEEAAMDLFSRSNDGIVFVNLRGQITDINNAALKILDARREDTIDRNIDSLMPSPYSFKSTRKEAEELSFPSPEGALEGLVTTTDFFMRRRVAGRIISIHNVTEMKRAERIRDEKRALELQVVRAQDGKMMALGQLASGMIHNFNNMLTGVLGYASLLRYRIGDNKDMLKPLDGITGAVNNAMAMSKHLLEFARSRPTDENEAENLIADTVDVHQCIENALGLIRHSSGQSLQLADQLKAERYQLPGSSADIENTILNLFINARDAMNREGKITIITSNVSFNESDNNAGLRPGDYLQIDITDTGPGIEQKVLPQIFEPFFTTKKSSGGTGLGLSSAWGIIRKHRGRIEVSQTGSSGTTFCILLPVDRITLSPVFHVK